MGMYVDTEHSEQSYNEVTMYVDTEHSDQSYNEVTMRVSGTQVKIKLEVTNTCSRSQTQTKSKLEIAEECENKHIFGKR